MRAGAARTEQQRRDSEVAMDESGIAWIGRSGGDRWFRQHVQPERWLRCLEQSACRCIRRGDNRKFMIPAELAFFPAPTYPFN
jgi:hypothetical protein